MRFRLLTDSTLGILLVVLMAGLSARPSCAQTGLGLDTQAWLRYAPLDARAVKGYQTLPPASVLLGKSPVLETAQRELGF